MPASATLEIFFKARDQLTKTSKKVKQSVDSIITSAKKLDDTTTSNFSSGLDQAKASSNGLRGSLTRLSDTVKRTTSNLSELNKKAAESGERLRSAGANVAAAGAAMIAPFAASSVTFGRFEATMKRVKGLTNASASEMEELTKVAEDLGRTTKFTAKEAADGLVFLVQAGLDTRDAAEALPGALALASAGSLGLAEAADIATNVISGLGEEMSELGRINDVLAFTAANANTNVSELGQGMKNAAVTLSNSRESFEAGAAVMAALGNAGIKGGEAGTGLRNVLIRLQRQTPQATKELEKLNISLKDSEGNFIGLIPSLEKLGEANLSVEAAANIFGVYAQNSALAAIKQVEFIKSLNIDLLEKAAGTTERLALTNLEGLAGDAIKTGSAISGLAIAIGEKLAPIISSALVLISDFSNAITTAIKSDNPLVSFLIKFTAGVAGLATVIGTVLIAIGTFSLAMGGLSTVATAGRVAVLSMIPSLNALGAAVTFALGPVGLLLAAVTTLAIALDKDKIKQWVLNFRRLTIGFDKANKEALAVAKAMREINENREKARELASQYKSLRDELVRLKFTTEELAAFDGLTARVGAGLVDEKAAREGFNQYKLLIDDLALAESRLADAQSANVLAQTALIEAETKKRQELQESRYREEIESEEKVLEKKKEALKSYEDAVKASEDNIAKLRSDAASVNDSIDRRLENLRFSRLTPEDQNIAREALALKNLKEAELAVRKAKTESEILAAQAFIEESRRHAVLVNDGRETEKLLLRLKKVNEDRLEKGVELSLKEAAANKENAKATKDSFQASVDQIEFLKKKIKEIGEKPIDFKANADQALAELRKIENRIKELRRQAAKGINIKVSTSGGGGDGIKRRDGGDVPRFASGGQLSGYGGGDKVNALLEPGEYVINKERTRRFGGIIRTLNSGSIDSIREMFHSINPLRLATGGPVASPNFAPPGSSGTNEGGAERPAEQVTFNFSLGSRKVSLFGAQDQVSELVEMLEEVQNGS